METIDVMLQLNIVKYVETLERLSAITGKLCKIAENQDYRICVLEKKIKELEATVKKLKEVSE